MYRANTEPGTIPLPSPPDRAPDIMIATDMTTPGECHIQPDRIAAVEKRVFHLGKAKSQADLYSLQWQGCPALLKDFSARPWWLRVAWGRPMIAREARMLERAAGLAGVPRLLGRVGADALLMEQLSAKRMPRRREAHPPLAFFDRASELLRSLHERGASHGDLHRTNLLMDDRGFPYLIDFATGTAVGTGWWSFLSRWLFHCAARIDRCKLAEMKASYYPDKLTAEEAHVVAKPPLALKLGRFLRRNLLRYHKRRHRERLYQRLLRVLSSPAGESSRGNSGVSSDPRSNSRKAK